MKINNLSMFYKHLLHILILILFAIIPGNIYQFVCGPNSLLPIAYIICNIITLLFWLSIISLDCRINVIYMNNNIFYFYSMIILITLGFVFGFYINYGQNQIMAYLFFLIEIIFSYIIYFYMKKLDRMTLDKIKFFCVNLIKCTVFPLCFLFIPINFYKQCKKDSSYIYPSKVFVLLSIPFILPQLLYPPSLVILQFYKDTALFFMIIGEIIDIFF